MLLPVALTQLQLLLLLHTSAVSSSPMVELSMFFSVNTSSGSNCSAPSCSLHSPMKMLDSNLSTWWQSQDGEQPVLVELQALHVLKLMLKYNDYWCSNFLAERFGVQFLRAEDQCASTSTNDTVGACRWRVDIGLLPACKRFKMLTTTKGSI